MVLLRLEGLTTSETESWQHRLNAHYSACGCNAGAVVMVIAIGLYVLYLSLRTEDLAGLGWLHMVAGGLIGLLGAAVGKVLGLGWARHRLRQTVEQLTVRLA